MGDKNRYYILYPPDYDRTSKDDHFLFGLDYDKLIGYVFEEAYESNLGTVYLNSIYPNTDTHITVDREFMKSGKSGLRRIYADDTCPLCSLPSDGATEIPKCRWYGTEDGACFLHGAGCSPLYRQDSATMKWKIPLDEER